MAIRVGLVSSLTLGSRVLGLARDMVVTALLGASVWNSAFVTAFMLPNLFRRLLGEGALTASLMPQLSDAREAGGRAAVFGLLNQTLSWLACACLAVTGLATGALVSLRWTGASDKWLLAADLSLWLFPYLVFVCLAAAIVAALNLLERFGVPAMGGIWLNVAILAALGIAAAAGTETMEGRTAALCLGVLAGGALQLAAPAWSLWAEGWRPRLDFRLSPRLRQVAALTAPGVFGLAVYQLNTLVSRALAYATSDAGATYLYLANRLVELPIGVFTIAIATVVFPALSAAVSRGEAGAFGSAYRRGTLLAATMALPSAAGLAALAEPIVAALFERGLFGPEDTRAAAAILTVFAAGLPFVSMASIEARAFYALKDTKTPVKVAAAALAVNACLSVWLVFPLGALGLALASNIAAAHQAAALRLLLRRRSSGASLAGLRRELAKLLLASAAMGAALWPLRQGLAEAGWSAPAIAATGVAAGVGGYAAALLLLRASAANELTSLVRARLGR